MEEVVHCVVVENGNRSEIDLPLGSTLEHFMNTLNQPKELTYFSESGKRVITNENDFKQCVNNHAHDTNDRIIFNISRLVAEEKKKEIEKVAQEREEKDKKYLKHLEKETKQKVRTESKQYKSKIDDTDLAMLQSLGYSKNAILTAVHLYGSNDYNFLLKTLDYTKSNTAY